MESNHHRAQLVHIASSTSNIWILRLVHVATSTSYILLVRAESREEALARVDTEYGLYPEDIYEMYELTASLRTLAETADGVIALSEF